MLRVPLKTLFRFLGTTAPRQARSLLRIFKWNSDYYLRVALLMNVRSNLGGVVRVGPLRDLKFEGLLYEELDPVLRNQMEPVLSSLILELDLKDKIVLDIGASYGYYTALFARCVGELGTVYAFEPDVQSLLRLARNMDINGFRNAVFLPYALSKEVHADVWEIDLLQPWNNRLIRKGEQTGSEMVVTRPIITIPLNLLLDSLPVEHIKLIKIDVEGAEVHVLQGANKLFETARPLALIELHSAELARQVFQLLKHCGYAWETIEFKSESRHHVFAFPQESEQEYSDLLLRFTAPA